MFIHKGDGRVDKLTERASGVSLLVQSEIENSRIIIM